jgi:hypothetical protein
MSKSTNKKTKVQEGFGTTMGNLLIGKEATAGIRKLGGMAAGNSTGRMSVDDIMARDAYIKDFTSKVSAAIDSGIKSGTLAKAAPEQASEPEQTAAPESPAQIQARNVRATKQAAAAKVANRQMAPRPAKAVAESESKKPKIRTYTKTYANGEKVSRYEVLDYKGQRVSGQGSEGFDDKKTAIEFLRKNKIKFSDPLNEASANSQTISDYVVSTTEYYAQQAGIPSIDKFKPTVVGIANQIEQLYPNRKVKALIQQLANLVYSLTSSTMQRGADNSEFTDQTAQVMRVLNAMNKPTDIDDVTEIAKAAIRKLYRGDQAMMDRMFNAVDVKAQERMGKGIGSQK